MKMNLNRLGRATALAVALMGVSATAATAAEVTLKSADGTVNLTGEFVSYNDEIYTIKTALGNLQVSASRVSCIGEDCPTFDTVSAQVTFAGSETVGLGLMPLLLSGYGSYLDAEASVINTDNEGEILVNLVGDEGFGDDIGSLLVNSTSSSKAFEALGNQTANIGMSSRRIKPAEARALRDGGAGNMVSPAQEHIVAVDSLVVITHPDNPINSISTEHLQDIYAGKIRDWSEIGGTPGPIKVINRQFTSGTRSVFESGVFGDKKYQPGVGQVVAANNNEMAALVNGDKNAIGYVGYAFQRGAKGLDLVNECGLLSSPDEFSAKTEEYALQRRLYLYNRADGLTEPVTDFIDFATSESADGMISKSGFISLGIKRRAQSLDSARARAMIETTTDPYEVGVMRDMLALMPIHDRLSSTFRFRQGSSKLDEKARLDMDRLIRFLELEPKGTSISLVGFTDSVGVFEANRSLSMDRSRQVAFDLKERANGRIDHINISTAGFGEMSPTGCNTSAKGQANNRRVEVWIETGTPS